MPGVATLRAVARRPVIARLPRSWDAAPRRLGIYVDGPHRIVDTDEGPRVAPDPADFPFLSFACAVGSRFDETVIFGRASRLAAVDDALILPKGVSIAALPPYESLRRLGQVARATSGTVRGFWRGLTRVDAVWVFGPHPFSFLLVALALVRRKRVVLGVRQDTVAYFRGRLPSDRWKPALLAVQALEAGFRRLARVLPTTVVGEELARTYGDGPNVRAITVSLVRDGDIVERPLSRDWSTTIELLTVGRIDREKNPFLLVEALAQLERNRPGRFRLTWAGTGPLADAVRKRADELGVGARIELLGFIPFGSELLTRYRRAHTFVHVSLTEGLPAVLIEALASGTPIVATDVGGVAAALGDAAVLVPPDDVDALVEAIVRVGDDSELRAALVERGLSLVGGLTLDAQTELIASFVKAPAALRA